MKILNNGKYSNLIIFDNNDDLIHFNVDSTDNLILNIRYHVPDIGRAVRVKADFLTLNEDRLISNNIFPVTDESTEINHLDIRPMSQLSMGAVFVINCDKLCEGSLALSDDSDFMSLYSHLTPDSYLFGITDLAISYQQFEGFEVGGTLALAGSVESIDTVYTSIRDKSLNGLNVVYTAEYKPADVNENSLLYIDNAFKLLNVSSLRSANESFDAMVAKLDELVASAPSNVRVDFKRAEYYTQQHRNVFMLAALLHGRIPLDFNFLLYDMVSNPITYEYDKLLLQERLRFASYISKLKKVALYNESNKMYSYFTPVTKVTDKSGARSEGVIIYDCLEHRFIDPRQPLSRYIDSRTLFRNDDTPYCSLGGLYPDIVLYNMKVDKSLGMIFGEIEKAYMEERGVQLTLSLKNSLFFAEDTGSIRPRYVKHYPNEVYINGYIDSPVLGSNIPFKLKESQFNQLISVNQCRFIEGADIVGSETTALATVPTIAAGIIPATVAPDEVPNDPDVLRKRILYVMRRRFLSPLTSKCNFVESHLRYAVSAFKLAKDSETDNRSTEYLMDKIGLHNLRMCSIRSEENEFPPITSFGTYRDCFSLSGEINIPVKCMREVKLSD